MISLHDATTLVRAKLLSKRILLGITVVVSGLLFGILFATSIIVSGASRSAHEYTRTALDDKYLVKSTPVLPDSIFGAGLISPSQQIITELTAMQAEYIDQQRNLAKQLDIPFDEKSVESIFVPDPYAAKYLPENQRVRINNASPIYQKYLQKLQNDYVKTAKNKLSDLKAAAMPYGATEYHQNEQATVNYTTLHYLVKGNEDFSKLGQDAGPQNSDATEYGYLTFSVRNSSYAFMDDTLIKRFILPENDRRRANATSIPVVITATEAVDLFGRQYGIAKKPKGTSEEIAWTRNLQEKLNGATYSDCYRNSADTARLVQIAQTAREIEKNKNTKGYTLPSLMYSLPSQPCGDIAVSKDTWSAQEIKTAQQELDRSKQLGTYEEPKHQLLTFVVVGIMPVSPQGDALTSLPSFMSALLGAQYGVGAVVPKQMFEKLPLGARHEDVLQDSGSRIFDSNAFKDAGIGETIIAFSSVDAARSFITQGCIKFDTSCKKSFVLESYGSNYLLADDLNKTATKFLRTALPIAVGIAGIIIWATMARVIIDSRRETAVFRAMGAKRRDIMGIYMLYSFIVAVRIVGFSILLGSAIALLAHSLYSGQATNYAKVAYGVFDTGRPFSFIGIEPGQLAALAISIIGISLVAVLPPLIRNVRRNPIDDMRDE